MSEKYQIILGVLWLMAFIIVGVGMGNGLKEIGQGICNVASALQAEVNEKKRSNDILQDKLTSNEGKDE